MSECKIHNVGFYKPEARAIYCMAMEPRSGKLALARSDAGIEVWNLNHTPFIEKTIPPSLDNYSVEGLCWSEGRLYSAGLHGWLVEYDLYALAPKNKWSVTGEAGTCLDSHANHVAVGTELGYINIFQTSSDGAEFEKFLDKQEGRIVCLRYCKRGEFVVGGSINAIRVWNVHTGHAVHRMVLGRAQASKDTVVWCLEVMNDLKIFSGDSRGVLTLWDGKVGAQIESYQSHQADITSICLDDQEESIYLAGVDPVISTYQKIKVGSNTKWVKSIQRKIHDHDVRAMAWHKGRLYSGGIDSYLVCSFHPPKTLIKFPPTLQSPCCETTMGEDRKILLRYSRRVEVWSLSSAGPYPKGHLGPVEPKAEPRKLVVIQKLGKNWQEGQEAEGVTCATISGNGCWIFMATANRFNLYTLNFDFVNDQPKLDKVDDLDDSNARCLRAVFNNKRNQLLVALATGKLIVYDLEDGDPFIFQRIDLMECNALQDSVSLMTVSECGVYVALADCQSNVAVFKHDTDGYCIRARLPRFAASPTALAVGPAQNVVVAYSDNKVYEYDLELRKSSGLSAKLEQCGAWKGRQHTCRAITFDSSNNVLLHDDGNVIVIKRNSETAESAKKKSKNSTLTNGKLQSELEVCIIPKYKHLVHVSKLAQNEFVVVEANPLFILEQLPPAFAQKTFGAK